MTNQTKIRESFIIYRSFIEALEPLEKDDKLAVYEAISYYALDKKEPKLTGFAKSIFTLIRPQLDANIRKFENGCKEKLKKAKDKQEGSKDKAKDKQKISKSEGNVNVNDNVNVNEECKSKLESKLESKSKSKFTPPTLQQVKNYCQERVNNVNPDKFINYYQANGWKVGKNPMKDWKACVRTWEQNSKDTTTTTQEDYYNSLINKY